MRACVRTPERVHVIAAVLAWPWGGWAPAVVPIVHCIGRLVRQQVRAWDEVESAESAQAATRLRATLHAAAATCGMEWKLPWHAPCNMARRLLRSTACASQHAHVALTVPCERGPGRAGGQGSHWEQW